MNDFWWNFEKGEFDILHEIPGKDEEAIKYIPASEFSKTAYRKFRKAGKNIKESMKSVLELFYDKNQ